MNVKGFLCILWNPHVVFWKWQLTPVRFRGTKLLKACTDVRRSVAARRIAHRCLCLSWLQPDMQHMSLTISVNGGWTRIGEVHTAIQCHDRENHTDRRVPSAISLLTISLVLVCSVFGIGKPLISFLNDAIVLNLWPLFQRTLWLIKVINPLMTLIIPQFQSRLWSQHTSIE